MVVVRLGRFISWSNKGLSPLHTNVRGCGRGDVVLAHTIKLKTIPVSMWSFEDFSEWVNEEAGPNAITVTVSSQEGRYLG